MLDLIKRFKLRNLTQLFNDFCEVIELDDGSFDVIRLEQFLKAVELRESTTLVLLDSVKIMLENNKPRTEIIDKITSVIEKIKESQE